MRSEIVDLSSFSVHADQSELLGWLRAAPNEPDAVYVVHGEARAASALRDAVREQLGWCAAAPSIASVSSRFPPNRLDLSPETPTDSMNLLLLILALLGLWAGTELAVRQACAWRRRSASPRCSWD